MQVQAGAEDIYLVTSVNGRCVATFADKRVCAEWLEQRKNNGVTYRLFLRKTDTSEVTQPLA